MRLVMVADANRCSRYDSVKHTPRAEASFDLKQQAKVFVTEVRRLLNPCRAGGVAGLGGLKH